MSERHADPVARPLRIVTAPGSGDVTGAPGSEAEAVAVVPMPVTERGRATARRAGSAVARTAGELWLHPDRLGHALWHGSPSTMAGHRDYIKSRAWVPAEMTGRPEKAVILAGVLYHLIIARPLKAAAKTVDAAADRPLRLLGLLLFVIVLSVLLARYL